MLNQGLIPYVGQMLFTACVPGEGWITCHPWTAGLIVIKDFDISSNFIIFLLLAVPNRKLIFLQMVRLIFWIFCGSELYPL